MDVSANWGHVLHVWFRSPRRNTCRFARVGFQSIRRIRFIIWEEVDSSQLILEQPCGAPSSSCLSWNCLPCQALTGIRKWILSQCQQAAVGSFCNLFPRIISNPGGIRGKFFFSSLPRTKNVTSVSALSQFRHRNSSVGCYFCFQLSHFQTDWRVSFHLKLSKIGADAQND